MPATTSLRDPFLADLHRRGEAVAARARSAADGMNDATFHRTPAWGGWSVGQIYEHLCIANGSYVEPLRAALAANPPRVAEPRRWKRSLMGGLLLGALDPKKIARKLPAPPKFRPGPTPRPDVVEEFVRTTGTLNELVCAADGVDLGRVRFVSPANAIFRMNLADALAVPVVHAERHLIQVERTRAAVGA